MTARRPVPEDFLARRAELGSIHNLVAHYCTGRQVVSRWLEETKCERLRRPCRECLKCGRRITRRSKAEFCGPHRLEVVRASITLREAIRDYRSQQARPFVFVTDIIGHAANVFGVSRADICSHARHQKFITPRCVIYYLARELTEQSLTQIGAAIGGRDHSTVMHGLGKCVRMMETDSCFAAQVEKVRALALGGKPTPEPTSAPLVQFTRQIRATAEPICARNTVERDAREWWEMDDDEFIASRIAEYRASGGDFVETRT